MGRPWSLLFHHHFFGRSFVALLQHDAPLQHNRLKGIWRHPCVVAVNERRIVGLASDINRQAVDNPDLRVGFAQERHSSSCSGLSSVGSVSVFRGVDRLGKVTCYSKRDMIEKVTGLKSRPSTNCPRLAIITTEVW